ncbi:Ankyrin repeat domain-containing protein 53 [Durusdinium trenchii]|uniref:Ankyrin repeat domain-containing protein 53 n=1 Tax=Durusdinium trenchii TaxID=1381693 RepID=A0ABP0NRD9_9DINO
MSLPCEHENEVTYVNRVLAFIFATDDSFAARQMNGLSGKERKEFELLRHLAANAFPWAAQDVPGVLSRQKLSQAAEQLREMEKFGAQKIFLKLAGGVKRRLLERAAAEAPPGLVVAGARALCELGTYVGFSSMVLAFLQKTGVGRMPVRIVQKDDLRKAYPPNGIPTAKNQTPDDFLFQACQYSVSMASLDRALQKGANVNARNKDGNSPLMIACQNWTASQYMPFVQKLLDQKAEVNVESGWGFTPLDKVAELLKEAELARKQEILAQEERREIMEGRSIVGYGYGTAEEQRQRLIPNQPLADELDTFKCLPQLPECKKLLESKGAKPGDAPFNPAYLTTEEFVERRDAILERYKDAKYRYTGH